MLTLCRRWKTSIYQQIKISINLFAYTYIGILGKVSKEKLSNINRSHLHQAQPNNKMNQWTNGPNINRDHLHQAQPEQMETTFQSTNTIRDLSRGLWPSYFHRLESIFYPAIYTSPNLLYQIDFLCKFDMIFNIPGNARVCELVFVATFEGAFSEYLAVFDLFSYMKWYMTNSSSMASLLQILTLASTTVLANKSLFIHYSLLAIFETI